MEQLLPLPHHAKEPIIQDEDLQVHIGLHDGAKLLNGHLDATVTNDRNHGSLWRTKFCTDACRQSKTHRTQSTGCNIAFALCELCVSASHHLVLAHIRHNHSIATCVLIQCPDHFAHGHGLYTWIQLFFDHYVFFFKLTVLKFLQPLRIHFTFYLLCQ